MKSEISTSSYITSVEAGKRFGFTNDHISRLCRQGRVSCTQVGKVWYLQEASFQAYLAEEKGLSQERAGSLVQVRKEEYKRHFEIRDNAVSARLLGGRSMKSKKKEHSALLSTAEGLVAGFVLLISVTYGSGVPIAAESLHLLAGGLASMPQLVRVSGGDLTSRIKSAVFFDVEAVVSASKLLEDRAKGVLGLADLDENGEPWVASSISVANNYGGVW